MLKKSISGMKINIILIVTLGLALNAFEGCTSHPKIFTVGIACGIPFDSQIIQGFKAGMNEFGYIEDDSIRYIYTYIPEMSEKTIDSKIREVMTHDIDLILTFEKNVSLRAKEIVKDTSIPVLFSANIKLEKGLVENRSHPGGNLTGVQFADTNLKALEWMVKVIPKLKKIYLPYNPDDPGSVDELAGLDKIASEFGIELVMDKVHSAKDVIDEIEKLPKDVNAIFRIPSLSLNQGNVELCQTATKKGIPVGASLLLNGDILVTLTNDFYNAGKQAARLAHQIRQGVKPADIPVETSETQLIINLKVAQKLGIYIPDDVLMQAKTIVH